MRKQGLRWFGHVEKMDDERTPVKAKKSVDDGSKKDRPKKRWKEVVEKDMLARGLRTDIPDRSFWRLGGKKRLTPAHWENKPDSWRIKIFLTLLKQMDNDDMITDVRFCNKIDPKHKKILEKRGRQYVKKGIEI